MKTKSNANVCIISCTAPTDIYSTYVQTYQYHLVHTIDSYLYQSFVSPLANNRTDNYGGSLENRLRLSLEVAKRVRSEWSGPIFYRLSATDWAEGPEKNEAGEWLQWGNEQSSILAQKLKDEAEIDLIDVSSGGLWAKQKIPVGPGYQVCIIVTWA